MIKMGNKQRAGKKEGENGYYKNKAEKATGENPSSENLGVEFKLIWVLNESRVNRVLIKYSYFRF